MRTTDRARYPALALLAAVAGMAAVGLAVLAQAGVHVCGHHVALPHDHAMAIAGLALSSAAHGPEISEGICPIVLYAAGTAAGLGLLALLVLAGSRASAPVVVTVAARILARMRLGPLTALIGCAGAVPVVAILASEGVPEGPMALLALAGLIVGAFLTAVSLAGTARLVLSAAERLVVALIAAFRLLAPGADAPWLPHRGPVLVAGGVRLVRSRPSRAPPLRL
jgi:hypothetical protein